MCRENSYKNYDFDTEIITRCAEKIVTKRKNEDGKLYQ